MGKLEELSVVINPGVIDFLLVCIGIFLLAAAVCFLSTGIETFVDTFKRD